MTRDEALLKALHPASGPPEPLHRILAFTGWPEGDTLEVLERLVARGQVLALAPWRNAARLSCCYVAAVWGRDDIRRFQAGADRALQGHGASLERLARAGEVQRRQAGKGAPGGVRWPAASGGGRGGGGLGAGKGSRQ